ncbi:MAG: C39 family peptidase [Nocardioidaceae bacterium]
MRMPLGVVPLLALTLLVGPLQTGSGASTAPTGGAMLPVTTADRSSSPSPTASAVRHVRLTRWSGQRLLLGTSLHSRLHGAGLQVARSAPTIHYDDPFGSVPPIDYDRGFWYSPWVEPGFDLTQLIASYDAKTPVGTFIEVAARGRTPAGRRTSWDSLGRWASSDHQFHRMSLGPQRDDLTRVAVDTLVTTHGVSLSGWQVRVALLRRTGTSATPTLTQIGAVGSRLPAAQSTTSTSRFHRGRDLSVPRYSQEIHTGEYPRYNGGGEAWCSPTTTAMLLSYFDRGPTPRQLRWIDPSYRQPWVDHAARSTFAWGYDGTGDWPFNTAYAGEFGLDTFVTRLRSLREAELFIRAGIPLAASIAFGPGELDHAPIQSTAGHLVVIRGFTDRGGVVVNDPAAPTANTVRRVYRRGQFERAWTGSTGGVVYVMHPARTPLPEPRRHPNW